MPSRASARRDLLAAPQGRHGDQALPRDAPPQPLGPRRVDGHHSPHPFHIPLTTLAVHPSLLPTPKYSRTRVCGPRSILSHYTPPAVLFPPPSTTKLAYPLARSPVVALRKHHPRIPYLPTKASVSLSPGARDRKNTNPHVELLHSPRRLLASQRRSNSPRTRSLARETTHPPCRPCRPTSRLRRLLCLPQFFVPP